MYSLVVHNMVYLLPIPAVLNHLTSDYLHFENFHVSLNSVNSNFAYKKLKINLLSVMYGAYH